MTIDAWVECADAVMAAGGTPDHPAGAALCALGLAAEERDALISAIRGRTDPAGLMLLRIAERAEDPLTMHQPAAPTDPTRMDVALALAADLATRPLPGIVDALRSGAPPRPARPAGPRGRRPVGERRCPRRRRAE